MLIKIIFLILYFLHLSFYYVISNFQKKKKKRTRGEKHTIYGDFDYAYSFISFLFISIFQVIHTEAYIGQSKVKSAAATCRSYVTSLLFLHYYTLF